MGRFNQLVQKLQQSTPPRTGRSFVVGDIHGCSATFRSLCEEALRIDRGDTMYLLGDLVSKGPDSIGVLRYVEDLRTNGVEVTVIRGNHEEAILRAQRAGKGTLRSMLERTRNTALLDEEKGKRLAPQWNRMFEESVYVVVLDTAILVHGGIDFTVEAPYESGENLVHLRETRYDAEAAGGRRVIHGHTRHPLSGIIESLTIGGQVLPLDNGAVGASRNKPYKISEYGNLCSLDLDENVLYVQPNRDVASDDTQRPSYSIRIRPHSQQ